MLAELLFSGSIDFGIDLFFGRIAWQLGQVPSGFGKTRILQFGQVGKFIFLYTPAANYYFGKIVTQLRVQLLVCSLWIIGNT
jgi:hypothetical protein